MEYQTIKEKGKIKYVVLPVDDFERLDRGWTQSQLAERIGVRQSRVAKWERTGAVFRKETRGKLARVFGVGEAVFP